MYTVEIRKNSEKTVFEVRRTNAPSFVRCIPGSLFLDSKESEDRGTLLQFALQTAQAISTENEIRRKQRISSAISDIFRGMSDAIMLEIR